MSSNRCLLTSTTHEIPILIRYLAVPIISFPLASAEAEKMFSQLKIVKTKLFTQMSQDFLNALIRIRHDSNSFDKGGVRVVILQNSRKKFAKSEVSGLQTFKFCDCGIYIDPKL